MELKIIISRVSINLGFFVYVLVKNMDQMCEKYESRGTCNITTTNIYV